MTSATMVRENPSLTAPWHNVGKITTANTIEQALKDAEMNWTAKTTPVLYTDHNGIVQTMPGAKVVMRSDNGQALATAGSRYTPVANTDAFGFAQGLLNEGFTLERLDTYLGKTPWMLLKAPYTLEYPDTSELYLLITNSFDGSSPIRLSLAPIRLACMNSLRAFLRKAFFSHSIRHTLNVQQRFNDAVDAMNVAKRGLQELDSVVKEMHGKKVSESEFKSFLENLIPLKDCKTSILEERRANTLMTIDDIYHNAEDQRELIGTGLGVMNSVTHYLNTKEMGNRQGRDNASARMWGLVNYDAKALDARAFELLN